jgi:hypothetical protein
MKKGDTFNRLTLISDPTKDKRSEWHALCRCECGTERTFRLWLVLRGTTKSCGCLSREVAGNLKRSHGMYGTRTYLAWRGMKTRCQNPNAGNYREYGGSGITVAPEWEAFESFFADMGECPEGLTLDRIDGTKGYEPGNCRWADDFTQSRNRRTNRILTFNGESLCIGEWAERTGIPYETLRARLSGGWSVEKALTTPVMTQFSRSK